MTPYPDVVTNKGHVQVPARNGGPGRTRRPTVAMCRTFANPKMQGEPGRRQLPAEPGDYSYEARVRRLARG
jgi:hypothetical protein